MEFLPIRCCPPSAEKYGKTPRPGPLRWNIQRGWVIPKSVHPQRMRENAEVWDFQLSREEMEAIEGLDTAQ